MPPPPPGPPVEIEVTASSPDEVSESDPAPAAPDTPIAAEPEPPAADAAEAPPEDPITPESETAASPDIPEPPVPAPAEPTPESDDPDRLAPEKTPFPTREADLAATRGVRPKPEPEPQAPEDIEPMVGADAEAPAAAAADPTPSVADGVLEERRRLAHEAYQDMERVRPSHARSFPVFAIIIAVLAVAVVAWYVFVFNRGDDSTEATPATTTTVAIDPETGADIEAQIQAVIDGLGVGSIMVDQRDGTIFIVGAVGSEADRSAVIGATSALAGDLPVDSEGLVLTVADDDLRAAALQAISDAGFDKINVSVSGGVATITGVTPDAGVDDLIAAVRSVDGIDQVVDLTETFDRAAALDNELSRITAVTPIVYESGQIDLNALQERILDSAAEIILTYPGPIVTIVGYTDSSGTAEENEQISLLRGSRVRDYLIEQGVPGERLILEGRGEAESTGSAAVAGLERRVEFEVGYAVPAGGDADFRIGIVAPSARNDLAFTQSIFDAANLIALERGSVGIDISDGLFVPEDAEAALRAYAADGYDLVIAHGSQYGASLATLAPEFPNTAFAWGTAADTFGLPNISAYEVSANEGGYVMGVVAASVTESDVIGVVGPLEVGDAALFVNGFVSGVNASNPAIQVDVIYTGSFGDVALAAEAATTHVDAGADVLTGSAQMVVGAVGVASENGAAWFGNQSNQTELAPSLVVASQVYHFEVALRQIISNIDQGVLGGESYTLNLSNGGVVIEYNPDYELPDDVLATADAVTAGIISGTVVPGG